MTIYCINLSDIAQYYLRAFATLLSRFYYNIYIHTYGCTYGSVNAQLQCNNETSYITYLLHNAY